tara:strand:+ start:1453 stop:1956 length:504 start_codon:yes stop_codon:yes gene_type:complete
MKSKFSKHNLNLYNILLTLSRNLFFYKKIGLADSFETRIYLMFLHFSIYLIIFKKKGLKFDQDIYDNVFNNIEYNLRELGFGDVTVNKKMKELNKIFYDILLKIDLEQNNQNNFKINSELIKKYFNLFKNKENSNLSQFIDYFLNFYNFCFEIPLNSMVEDSIKFKF